MACCGLRDAPKKAPRPPESRSPPAAGTTWKSQKDGRTAIIESVSGPYSDGRRFVHYRYSAPAHARSRRTNTTTMPMTKFLDWFDPALDPVPGELKDNPRP